MASANIMKLRGGAAAAILAHDHRHDGKDVQYDNAHINKDLSRRNGTQYYKGVHDLKMTAQDEYQRLQDRVAEIDRAEPPKRIRKDRVTMVGFEVPVPEGLPPEKENHFFKIAYKAFVRMCGGARNVSSLRIHRDEVHEYVDPVTKERRTSRVHAHAVGIPYVPGKGINCKSFMTRQALRDLQQDIDRQCRAELGVAFLDGFSQRSRGTVEDLKRASARTEQELAERIAAQEAQIAAQEARIADLRHEAEKASLEASRARTEALEAQESAESYRQQAGEMYKDLFDLGTLELHVDYVERFHQRDFELWARDRARDPEEIAEAVSRLRDRDSWEGPEL